MHAEQQDLLRAAADMPRLPVHLFHATLSESLAVAEPPASRRAPGLRPPPPIRAAADFCAVEVGTARGLVTYHGLTAPNMEARVEGFVRLRESGCLDESILFGENGTRRAVTESVAPQHQERTDQALDNTLLAGDESQKRTGPMRTRRRLGGLRAHSHRSAA